VSDSQADPTKAERWAARTAAKTSPLSSVMTGACVVLLAVNLLRFPPDRWLLATLLLFLVPFMEWEHQGFKRLLAKRDAEIARLRSEVGSD
jgi:hypothetical protein